MPSTPPGQVEASDDEEEEWDVPHGRDVPMTLDMTDAYEPTSPRSDSSSMNLGHLHALAVDNKDEDVNPAAESPNTREDIVKRLVEDNSSIMETLAQPGGSPKSYRRERSRAVKALVSEIYSAPRVIRAAKLLPSSASCQALPSISQQSTRTATTGTSPEKT